MRPFEEGGQSSPPGIEQQAEVLISKSSLPGLETSTDGETSLPGRRSLNPLFVEWLMGWPPGWTSIASNASACSATALCRWKQRMRSALSSLGSPLAALPVQFSLLDQVE